MNVSLFYFDSCPNWETTRRYLTDLTGEFGFDLELRLVRTPDEADALGFRGSPTVLVDGSDPFADPDAPVGLACRLYRTPSGYAGSPTRGMLRSALGQGFGR